VEPLVIRVSEAQLVQHDVRMRRTWWRVLLVSALVFAADIALQVLATEDGHADFARLFGGLPFALELFVLFLVVVGQFAGGAGVVVALVVLRGIRRRLRAPREDLELTLDRSLVTIARGTRIVHDAAPLLHVTAYPEWLRMTVDAAGVRTSFAVPMEAAQWLTVLEHLRYEPSVAVEERRSFGRDFGRMLAGHTSSEVLVHVVAHVIVLLIAAAVVGLLVLVGYAMGPLTALGVFLVLALVAIFAAVRRIRRREL
jgi:hypothetical protein